MLEQTIHAPSGLSRKTTWMKKAERQLSFSCLPTPLVTTALLLQTTNLTP